jgi:Tfp pilus assembly protein PilN
VALDYSVGPFKVDFEGVSKSLSSVFAYVNNLRDSGMLKEVDLKYANKKKAEEGQVIEFRITAIVVPEGLYVEE